MIMAPTAPPSFSDLAKSSNDIFSKDFAFGAIKTEIKTKSSNGIELKTTGSHDIETGRSTGDIEGKYKFSEYGLTFTEKWKTSNVVSAELSLEDKLLKGFKTSFLASFEPNTGKKMAKVKNSFKNEYSNCACDLDFHSSLPVIDTSAVFGYQNVYFGVNLGLDSSSFKPNKLHYSLAYQLSDLKLHIGAENGSKFHGSVYQKLSSKLETAVRFSWEPSTKSTRFGIASKFNCGSRTFWKLKVDNRSLIGCSLGFALRDGVDLTLSGNLDGRNLNGGGHQLGASIIFDA